MSSNICQDVERDFTLVRFNVYSDKKHQNASAVKQIPNERHFGRGCNYQRTD